MVARAALVLVGLAPGVEGHEVLLEIGAAPVGGAWIPHERLETGGGGGIGADVEAVLVEGRAEELDLGARRRLLGLAHATEEPRPHEAGEQPEDDDDHEQLDQGEAARVAETRSACAQSSTRGLRQGHLAESIVGCRESRQYAAQDQNGISVMERMAMSMATTMKPTTSPIARMMHGSTSATRRLTSLRVSLSKVAPTLSSISSIRPVSSPTRTMWMASGGKARVSSMGLARPAPRLAPSARLSTARAMTWLPIMSLTTPSAESMGTPLRRRVPVIRAKRATSVCTMTRPSTGSLIRNPSAWSRPAAVAIQMRRA